MFNTKTVSIEWGGQTLTLETGKVARQADGAVMASLGETVVLCAVTAAKSVKDGQDFFPLTVHYQEKYSAAGRIPGGFFKRERGATEKETLVSRLIDRPLRPLFPEGFYNEINAIAQVLSYDGENEPDILAIVAASAAMTISGVPFMGPIGAARVGYLNGEYILNPTDEQVAEGDLDLVVAATYDAVMMVESEANELSEEIMLGAVLFAHDGCREVVKAIVKLAEQAAKEPWDMPAQADLGAAKDKLKKLIGNELLLGYVGEVYFYDWARRHVKMEGSPFGAVKDVAILSALAGNLAFIFVFIPSAIAALDALGIEAISRPATATSTRSRPRFSPARTFSSAPTAATLPCTSLLLMLNMACTLMRLTPQEAILGATRHAALALLAINLLFWITDWKS